MPSTVLQVHGRQVEAGVLMHLIFSVVIVESGAFTTPIVTSLLVLVKVGINCLLVYLIGWMTTVWK